MRTADSFWLLYCDDADCSARSVFEYSVDRLVVVSVVRVFGARWCAEQQHVQAREREKERKRELYSFFLTIRLHSSCVYEHGGLTCETRGDVHETKKKKKSRRRWDAKRWSWEETHMATVTWSLSFPNGSLLLNTHADTRWPCVSDSIIITTTKSFGQVLFAFFFRWLLDCFHSFAPEQRRRLSNAVATVNV